MEIALLGGTGDLGEGLALRWAADADYDLTIGSRDADRGRDSADEYERTLARYGVDASFAAATNPEATAGADVVVLSVPSGEVAGTVETVADRLADDAVLVSPAIAMTADGDGLHYDRPAAGSMTTVAAGAAPRGVPVVGAFHSLPAGLLADLDQPLEMDTVVVGDDPDAKTRVALLAESIDGLRAVDAGSLANAAETESLAPLLINLGRYEDIHDAGVRFR